MKLSTWTGGLACVLAAFALAAAPARGDELSPEVRASVDKGLQWLAKTQHRDGHWEGNGGQYTTAMTALSAMALLMAIFRYQPSPFCILDEVDAPLDEPNIERLMRLLKDMSPQTQFIVITPAKRTMEAAKALYGVTMQEAGVSKVVSVRFE